MSEPYLTPITDHADRAVDKLAEPFVGKLRMTALASIIGARVQTVENAACNVAILRWLPNSSGAQLDMIGLLLGLARPPLEEDDDYRSQLGIWYNYLRSCGECERIITIVKGLTGGLVEVWEYKPAYLIVTIDGSNADLGKVAFYAKRTALAGVGLLLGKASADSAFMFSDADGYYGDEDDPDHGFADDPIEPTVGGELAFIVTPEALS